MLLLFFWRGTDPIQRRYISPLVAFQPILLFLFMWHLDNSKPPLIVTVLHYEKFDSFSFIHSHRERSRAYREKSQRRLPHFPRTPDALVRSKNMAKRMVGLWNWKCWKKAIANHHLLLLQIFLLLGNVILSLLKVKFENYYFHLIHF